MYQHKNGLQGCQTVRSTNAAKNPENLTDYYIHITIRVFEVLEMVPCISSRLLLSHYKQRVLAEREGFEPSVQVLARTTV